VLSAVSFLEPLLGALGVDVLPSLWVGDALDVAAAGHPPFGASTPALLTQLYDRRVASEVKLTLMGALPDAHAVALVHAAGDAPGRESLTRVEWLPLHAIDRSDAIGARTSLYVPPWTPERALAAADDAEEDDAERHAAAACAGGAASFEAVLAGVAAARDALEGPWQEGDPTHAAQGKRLLAAATAAAAAAAAADAPALQGALFGVWCLTCCVLPMSHTLTRMHHHPRTAALADVLLAVATHAQIAADDGDWAARHVLAAAAARAARLGGGGGGEEGAPRAPPGRGYTLEEGDGEEEGEDEIVVEDAKPRRR
jgi:hypothetical protein